MSYLFFYRCYYTVQPIWRMFWKKSFYEPRTWYSINSEYFRLSFCLVQHIFQLFLHSAHVHFCWGKKFNSWYIYDVTKLCFLPFSGFVFFFEVEAPVYGRKTCGLFFFVTMYLAISQPKYFKAPFQLVAFILFFALKSV